MDIYGMIVSAVGIFLLFLIPKLGSFFKKVDTFYHELSHGLVTLVTGGKIESIKIHRNESGRINFYTDSFLGHSFILFAGYTGSSLLSIITFYLMVVEKFELLFWFYLISLVIGTLIYVRNVYGFFWAFSLIGLLGISYYYLEFYYIQILITWIVVMQSVGSVMGSVEIFKISIKRKESAGDAWELRQLWKLPTVFFGFLFFLEGIAVVVINTYFLYLEIK